MKLFVSDFDYTFYRHFSNKKNKILQENIKAIIKLKQKGHIFTFCTGRNIDAIEKYTSRYNIPYDYIIGCTGAYVVDNNKNVIYKNPIEKSTVDKMIKYLEPENYFMYMLTGSHIVQNVIKKYKTISFHKIKAFILKAYMKRIKVNITDNWDGEVYQFGITTRSEGEAKKIDAYINDTFNEVHSYRNRIFINIIKQEISKETGVRILMNKLNISQDNVYTIGDNYNDLCIIKNFHGYAVHNAIEEVKKAAKKVVYNVSDAIEDLLV